MAQRTQPPSLVGSEKVGPDDPRYADLARKRFNKRFDGKPDYVHLVGSREQVVEAVQDAVREKRRVVARSGGHCLEGFVSDPAVRVVIDTSRMRAVTYDPEMGAFAVESGATLGEAYRKLFEGWGVILPAGESPDVGVGGHVLGGAFGFFCRQYGLAVDYLYGVEVVVVDESGIARSVVATREPSDPNRELWWAHTGGGGGNFGIVTRYWFRSPSAAGSDPAQLLPPAPDSVLAFRAEWSWGDIDEAAFHRLARNHGEWCERNSEPNAPSASLWTLLELRRRAAGSIVTRGVSTAGAEAERQIDSYLSAINEGIGASHSREIERTSWLAFVTNPFPDLFRAPGSENASFKGTDALLRRRFTDRQIAVAYDYLTRNDYDVLGGMIGLATYGGKVNTVAPDATAAPQRRAILDTACAVGWGDPRDEARSLAWARSSYRDLFADTGGVPVPGEAYDGALINHPDVDLADPKWNTSGVPWHTLYYQDNYARLQQVKARWDPRNVFHHALSIRARAEA